MIKNNESDCLENLFCFYSLIYIPIINIYCFLVTSKEVQDKYVIKINGKINYVNYSSFISSIVFDFGTYRGIFLFLILIIIYAPQHEENLIYMLAIYTIYSTLCKYCSKGPYNGYKFGVIYTNYFILFPIAIVSLIYALIQIIKFLSKYFEE